MKKLMAMILALMFCLCLSACGGKKTTVEITADNWENFLEVREIGRWMYNDFNEPYAVEVAYGLCVKDEYADKIDWEKVDLTVEVAKLPDDMHYELDLENLTYEIQPVEGPNVFDEETYTLKTDIVEVYREDETFAKENMVAYLAECIVDEERATDMGEDIGKCIFGYEYVKVSRIQGTIVVNGEVPAEHLAVKE